MTAGKRKQNVREEASKGTRGEKRKKERRKHGRKESEGS